MITIFEYVPTAKRTTHMKTATLILGLIFVPFILSAQTSANPKPCKTCEQLRDLKLPDVTILKVESLRGDTIKAEEPWLQDVIIRVPFCRVMGRISKEIHFELLVPEQWNGRFVMAGGGGFSGSIQNSLRDYVNQGFATAGTDTGHKGDGFSAEWALNNMERQLNFGKLAVHRTAVVSKSILQMHCAEPSYSYFIGCSRGGSQGMMEAQQYPEDFDGIVSGAPAFNWAAIGAQYARECKTIFPNPKDVKSVITNDNLKLLQNYILQQCDHLDGVKDRIINDPRACKIDFAKLPRCPGNTAGPSCFTQEQINAISTVYTPTMIDDKMVYPGFPVGLEAESGSWDMWITGTSPFMPNTPGFHYILGTNMFKYLIYNDPAWDYSKDNLDNFFDDTKYASAYLDATQTDYGGFKSENGKMIMYHGWNDPALSAFATIQHYDEAMRKDKDLQTYFRLFLLPGVLHCGSGTGPDQIDWLKPIQDWVERGIAPDKIVLSKIENQKTTTTRPVFPYPKMTVYSGKGDTNQEQSFKAK